VAGEISRYHFISMPQHALHNRKYADKNTDKTPTIQRDSIIARLQNVSSKNILLGPLHPRPLHCPMHNVEPFTLSFFQPFNSVVDFEIVGIVLGKDI